MKPSKPGAIDRELVAQNILSARGIQGLTQEELAERGKVSISGIFRAEKAKSVHLSTLKKIALGLNIGFDTLFVRKQKAAKIAIHRAGDAIWHAFSDRRPHVPENDLLRYKDREERIRLGHLGFVHSFMAPPTAIMKDGTGVVLLELFDKIEGTFNAGFYKDAVIYVIRGKATVELGSEEIEISEGDWVGYPTADLVMLRSTEQPGSPSYPTVVLWIGANRHAKKIRIHGGPDRQGTMDL